MSGRAVDCQQAVDVNRVVRCLHGLVTYGPGDLQIASAMSRHGYDAVKWAEGQCLLAQLLAPEFASGESMARALGWYQEAAGTARQVLPDPLLAKLGLEASTAE